MKAFRYILVTALTTIGIFSAALISGCKDKCGGTTCLNSGTCVSNICVCPTGYSGTSCGTGWTDPTIGTYKCTRGQCSPVVVVGAATWQSSVVKDATYGGYVIEITNFDNSNTTISATVDSVQNVLVTPAAGSAGVSGTGRYANDTLKLHYTTTSGSGGSSGPTCDMVLVKLR